MEHRVPAVEVDATYRIAKYEALKRRLSPCSHYFYVWLPAEFVVDIYPKVSDQRQATNLQGPATGNVKVNRRLEGTDAGNGCAIGLEGNELCFVRVNSKAISHQPVCNCIEAVSTFLKNRVVVGASSNDCTIVHIHG